ncbi:MAG: hypothetical protein KKB34_18365 [Bacteroidetes bacterium]|nr:hypothetical protein [Bacteroidota bacterium]
MKIYLPTNIFSALFSMMLPDEQKNDIEILPASLIAQKLVDNNDSLGLMPSCDLLKFSNLKVSNKIALSFDGLLSNSYLYFMPEQNRFDRILLRGDVSSNEVILAKILFKERFDVDVEISLDSNELDFEESNYLIVGQENDDYVVKHNGISFSDQIAEFINYPYVNFVLASADDANILSFVSKLENLDEQIEDNIAELLEKVKLPSELGGHILQNINNVYYEMTENEVEGLNELLKLPYFHGVVDDIVTLNFV